LLLFIVALVLVTYLIRTLAWEDDPLGQRLFSSVKHPLQSLARARA